MGRPTFVVLTLLPLLQSVQFITTPPELSSPPPPPPPPHPFSYSLSFDAIADDAPDQAFQSRGRYHGGRRPSSDDSLPVIPPSALDKPSFMKRYHRRRTTSWGVTARSPMIVTLHDTRFVECRWWTDGWTVVTWRSSASMIPAPDEGKKLVVRMQIFSVTQTTMDKSTALGHTRWRPSDKVGLVWRCGQWLWSAAPHDTGWQIDRRVGFFCCCLFVFCLFVLYFCLVCFVVFFDTNTTANTGSLIFFCDFMQYKLMEVPSEDVTFSVLRSQQFSLDILVLFALHSFNKQTTAVHTQFPNQSCFSSVKVRSWPAFWTTRSRCAHLFLLCGKELLAASQHDVPVPWQWLGWLSRCDVQMWCACHVSTPVRAAQVTDTVIVKSSLILTTYISLNYF